MFCLVFSDLMNPRKMDKLKELANHRITVRGYNIDQVSVAPELKNKSWFLPVNEIVTDYCPTNRYSYLRKYVSEAKIQLTWESLKGRIIDNLYKDVYKEFLSYTKKTKLKKLYIRKELEKLQEEALEKIKKQIEEVKDKMIKQPKNTEVGKFLQNINNILRFEIELCTAIVDHKISIKKDINIKSEIELLFPFIFKIKIRAPDLGFSGGLEPDFIYKHLVVGEIKTGEWQEFFKLACAAYALAYEFEHRKNLDLGVVLNPIFNDNRTVPLYYNSDISIIDDSYRKAVLILRDKKISLMREKKDPGIPKIKYDCRAGCGYINYCWGKKNEK